MKWYKHHSDSLDSVFVQALISKFGSNGYLAYFGLLEIIAKENGHILTGKIEVSPSFLKQKLHISSRKLQEIFKFCEGFAELFCNFSEVLWKLEAPKLLVLKDNYIKDLQVASNKPSNHIDIDKEEDKELKEKEQKERLLKEAEEAKRIQDEIAKKLLEEKRKRIKYQEDSQEIKACRFLIGTLLKNDPKRKTPIFGITQEKGQLIALQTWANVFHLTNSVDDRTWEEIGEAIEFVAMDDNWFNVQSPKSLREKFGDIVAGIKRHKAKNPQPTNVVNLLALTRAEKQGIT